MSSHLGVGRMVTYPGSPGIGRIGEFDAKCVRVDFFESVADPIADSVWIGADRCRPAHLTRETRVYRHNPDIGVWLAGRVIDNRDNTYFVRFPNVEYDLPVPESQLRVRWDRPVRDPVTVLTTGGNESAYHLDARMGMLRDLTAQRAAGASTFSFLSSAVELYPHQVRAALTVLSDPVQRYLLADEVGLGKTIEAGYIIRQTLIDNPRAKIAILTPEVLRYQWRRELTDKFFIDDFPHAQIRISSHETPQRWEGYLDCDLVVVDEAHQLVQVREPEDSPYRELCALAHSAPRLLLLSATPVTSHYTTHLGLLHLLDPTLYRWTDRESFEHRYELRSRLADSVYGLDADYTYMLPSSIEEIRDQLATEDSQFEELSSRVLELLDDEDELRAGTDEPEFVSRVEALRGHISEVYRLHRRVIRHRRDKVLRDDPDSALMPYEVRGRCTPEPLLLDSDSHAAIEEALFEWQSRVWDHLLDTGQEERKSEYARALATLVSRGSIVGDDLVSALRWRLHGDTVAAESASLDARERTALAAPPILPVEPDILESLEGRTTGDDERKAALDALVNVMLPVLRDSRRTVIFCGAGTLAADLATRMRKRFANANIGQHTQHLTAEALEEAVSAWLSPSGDNGSRAVLIVDASGEDGLNLQAADAVLHVRSPWSPNQLEQRLGRIDRYRGTESLTQDSPAPQYRIRGTSTEESFPDSWAELLETGYRIYTESVSTLQDAIAQGITPTWENGLEHGPAGLAESAERVRTDLDTARGEIDKMDMLESIHTASIVDHDVAQALGEYEAHWKQTREAMLNYASGPGGVKLRHFERTVKRSAIEVFDIAHARPLIDPRLWSEGVERLTSDSTRAGFNRSAVLKVPGQRLFRRGNPLVDMLSSVIAIDDRGQAAAFRRIDLSMRQGQDAVPYFGFDYLVEADIGEALALVEDRPAAKNALRRQADRILPPFMLKVWVQADSTTPITAPQQYKWLNRPYTTQPDPQQPADRNYNSVRTAELLQVFGGWDTYHEAAESARHTAREWLSEVTDLEQRCAAAQEEARRRISVSRAQAEARRAAGHLVGDAEHSFLDIDVTDALIEGLSCPFVHVVAATCVVRGPLERVQRGE